jgi:hypothetical protein
VDAREVEIHELVASSFKPFFGFVVDRLSGFETEAKRALDNDDLDKIVEILERELTPEEFEAFKAAGESNLQNASANLDAFCNIAWTSSIERLRKFKSDIQVEGFIQRSAYEKMMRSNYANADYCLEKGISDEDHAKAVAFVESVVNYDTIATSLLAIKTTLNDHAENVKWIPIAEKNPVAMELIRAVVAYKGLTDDFGPAITMVRNFNGVKPTPAAGTPSAKGGKSKLGSYVVHLPDGKEFGGSIKSAAFATMRHFGIKVWKMNSTETLSTDVDPVDNKALTGNTNSWHSIVVKIHAHLVEAGIADVESILYAQTTTGILVPFSEHK